MQTFYNSDSRNHVILSWNVGDSTFFYLGVVEAFHWEKLPTFPVHASDFAYVGILEEPPEFVSYSCHCFSLNILWWMAYFLRVMAISVVVSTVFYWSYVFSCFFLSLIMSMFIKNYNHSYSQFLSEHISLRSLCFRVLPYCICLLFTKFYSTTFFKISNMRAFIFSPFLSTFILQYHCQVKFLSFYLSQPPFLHHSLPFFWTLHLKNGSYMAIKKVQTRQSNIVLKYDFISNFMSM